MTSHIKLLLVIITTCSFTPVVSQNITTVPNPNAPSIFGWSGSGALSGYTGTPALFNNSLVLEYNPSGTSDIAQLVQQLAVYNGGDTLHLIPNPDNGQGVYFQSLKIVFNNKLFFLYLAATGEQRLASFDGTSVTLYPNPDASASGVIGSFRILNNNLYIAYQNVSGVTQLGRFNGSGITLIANPDASVNGYYNNYSTVFNNKIVTRYVTAAGPKQLATYDGTQWTILPNPDATPNRGVQPAFPVLYHNKLYFFYLSVTNQYQLLEYDGTNNPTLIANPQNSSSNTGGVTANWPTVIGDTLFIQYLDINGVYRLAKFGGSSITLVPNPDASTYGYYYTPVVYNNNLYILYQQADGTRHIGQYKSTTNSIQIFANPDASTSGYYDQPIVFGDKMYIRYLNAQNAFQLGSFDGSVLQLITSPSGIYTSSGNNGYMGQPIVWNEKLYLQYGSIPYNYAGNLAYFSTTNNGICPGSNTTFVSNTSGSTYQWQVDNGSGTFTNLNNAAPYSTVTTNTLTLTAPATTLYGYKFRCQVNGNTYSNTFTLKFASNWTGAVSTAWETVGNWSCGAVPDANTDVYISPGKPNYPVVNSTRSVRSVHLQNGTTMNVAAARQLTITGK